jgi:hypothetical protein
MNFHRSQPTVFWSRPPAERVFIRIGDAFRKLARDHKARRRDARAFKIDKVVRVTAFVFAAIVTAAIFGAFSAFAMSQLEPAQQEIISLAHARRLAAGNDQKVVQLEPITVVGHRIPAERSSAPVATPQ